MWHDISLTHEFFLIKKIKLKKLKKIKNKNDTWHNMSLTRVHFFKIKKFKKNLIKLKKNFKNKKKSQNDTWWLLFTSVNYFNGVSENNKIEKNLPTLGPN